MITFINKIDEYWIGIIQSDDKIYANTIPMNNKDAVLQHLQKYNMKLDVKYTQNIISKYIFDAWACKPIHVDFEIFDFSGYTEKEKLVLEFVYNIEYGKTMTYKEVAENIGLHNAARFVGNVMMKNRFPLLIPCHRVVRKDGIGKYGYGSEVKKRLIMCERRNKS